MNSDFTRSHQWNVPTFTPSCPSFNAFPPLSSSANRGLEKRMRRKDERRTTFHRPSKSHFVDCTRDCVCQEAETLCTELRKRICTWLREIGFCCCLTFLPDPVWLLFNKIYKDCQLCRLHEIVRLRRSRVRSGCLAYIPVG